MHGWGGAERATLEQGAYEAGVRELNDGDQAPSR